MSRLAHIFQDIDMRMAHAGLKDMLRSKRIKVKEGDFVVFLNSSRTIIKCFCNGTEALMHVKNNGKRLDLGVIKYLPKYCNGPELDLNGAVAENLKDLMQRRK